MCVRIGVSDKRYQIDRYQGHAPSKHARMHERTMRFVRFFFFFFFLWNRGEGSIMRETPRKGALSLSLSLLCVPGHASCRAPEEHFENEPITICVRLSRLRYPIRIIAAREITCKL